MISTKLFPGRNARLYAQRGYFVIHGRQERAPRRTDAGLRATGGLPPEPIRAGRAFLEIAGINDYSIFADLERLKNDIHRCDHIGVEDTHTNPQPETLRQGTN
jgi:hypothetical protein